MRVESRIARAFNFGPVPACSRTKKRHLPHWYRLVWLLLLSPMLSACIGNFIPSLRQPDRLLLLEEEIGRIRHVLAQADTLFNTYMSAPNDVLRNEIITLRMYAIDLFYTKYESQLTHESQDINFGMTAVNLGLTTAGGLLNPGETTRILSGVATAVTGLGTAYNEKILLTHTIQNIQAQMRANRYDQAALIYSNMKCPTNLYPLGMALGDIEGYYRAGTFTAGMVRLSSTVHKAETEAKAKKEAQTPAPLAGAQERLVAEANVKAAEQVRSACEVRVARNFTGGTPAMSPK